MHLAPIIDRAKSPLHVGDGAFMTITAYTHLESLLLFQALRREGVDTISFNRISEQLQSVPLIRNDPAFDAGRLSPDSLRELYLGLLKEEVKHDLAQQQNADKHITNGNTSPGSRKRKIASPVLPTVHEAAQHSHLIPQLVVRLYSRYRENAIRKIRGFESKYAEGKQYIEDVEAGLWDECLQRDDSASRVQERAAAPAQAVKASPKPSSTAHTQPILLPPDPAPTLSANASPILPKPPDRIAQAPPKRYSQAKIDAVINHGPESQDGPAGHRRVSSNTKLPPLSDMAPQSPRFDIPPNISGHMPQQLQAVAPHTHAPNHNFGQTPPGGHRSPYGSHHGHPRQGSISSPQIQQSLSRPSSSPRPILPPPPGMPLPPPSPVMHTGSPGQHQYATPMQQQQHYQLQHRPPPKSPAGGYQGSQLPPHASGYYQPPPPPQQPPYQDRRQPYQPQPQHPQTPNYLHQTPHTTLMQPHQTQMPPGGFMQPFQITPQEPSRPVLHQPLRPNQPPMLHSQIASTYVPQSHGTPATAPHLALQPNRKMQDILSMLATPPRRRMKPLWKEKYQPSPMMPSAEKPRPAVEPLSPMKEGATRAQSFRGHRTHEVPSVEETLQAQPPPKSRAQRRKVNNRDKSPGDRSVVSSTADDSHRARTRSQSVSTAAGANPAFDDRPPSRSGVKTESSTPADTSEDAVAPSATPASGRVTRKRRGTLQSQHQPPAKRKRQESPGRTEDGEASTPVPRSNTVMATRNFNKMSSAIMSDIQSHKHATYFAGPVRNKDAPGYSDIVRQPQNLKAIKAAITAGAHVVKAAASSTDSPSEAISANSSAVELERSVDTTPPKVIVNGAQLEKELMRMFANAYMFNPGEDGMALSTKEMFDEVEQKITEWRATERATDDDDDGKGKRRKV